MSRVGPVTQAVLDVLAENDRREVQRQRQAQEQKTLTWFLNDRAHTDALVEGANHSTISTHQTWTYAGNGHWVGSDGFRFRY